MKKTASQKAMAAALAFAQRGDWPQAILCILCAQKIDGQSSFSIGAIQRKFAELGFDLERVDIAMKLDELVENGLIGVFQVDPPDELGI